LENIEQSESTQSFVGAIAPHGGTLINRYLRGSMADTARETAKTL
jgi:hypothetical protein